MKLSTVLSVNAIRSYVWLSGSRVQPVRSLGVRLAKLEHAEPVNSLRPVLLVSDETDVPAELAAWQERYGPCDAEPLLIRLVGCRP
tara:strand:- start:126 stop:383 length:258 start_codon:yes stop_codon:yes gene_type:complete